MITLETEFTTKEKEILHETKAHTKGQKVEYPTFINICQYGTLHITHSPLPNSLP